MFRLGLLTSFLIVGVPIAQTAAPPASLTVRPLPGPEQFVANTSISVTLRVDPGTMVVGETPTFALLVRNTGRRPLALNPPAASNLRIFTAAGELVEPSGDVVADWQPRNVRAEDLVTLAPGATHEFQVQAEYHPYSDFSRWKSYRAGSSGLDSGMHLPPGEYSARFTYINYPDYGVGRYNVYAVPGAVWEGRIEAPPVPFRVLPLDDREVRELIARIEGPGDAGDAARAVERAGAARVAQAAGPLLRRFTRSPIERIQIAVAVHEIGGERNVRSLIGLIAAMPVREREPFIISRLFGTIARDAPGCAGVPLLLEAVNTTRGDVDSLLGEGIQQVGNSCPSFPAQLRDRLRSRKKAAPGQSGGGADHGRANAAEALGRIGHPADIPLLVSVVNRTGGDAASSLDDDAERQRAVRALGHMGGAGAGRALEALADESESNRAIVGEVVEALGRIQSAGASDAVSRALGSSDTTAVVRAIMAVRKLKAIQAVPRLQGLLTHRDAGVRVSASQALVDFGQVAPAVIVAFSNDPDPRVRANILRYLARYGDDVYLPRFVQGIVSPNQAVREASVEGIARLGKVDTYLPLRAALDTAPPRTNSNARRALASLTFTSIWGANEGAQWDEWWKAHSRLTRTQWAQEALDRIGAAVRPDDGMAIAAIPYLAGLSAPPARLLDRALSSPNWRVRAAASEVIGRSDRTRAAALHLSELNNRYVESCRNAVQRLSALANQQADIDCTIPASRAFARGLWSNLASGAPR
jgi:HEAT repeat protein